jgi:hypothetical protein
LDIPQPPDLPDSVPSVTSCYLWITPDWRTGAHRQKTRLEFWRIWVTLSATKPGCGRKEMLYCARRLRRMMLDRDATKCEWT